MDWKRVSVLNGIELSHDKIMKNKHDRREFIKTGLAGITAGILLSNTTSAFYTDEPYAELNEITVADLQSKMTSGELSSRRITEMYLARIRELDSKLLSVIEINPDAQSIADKADSDRKKGRVRSAIHGIPVLIKDNIDTRDRMKTTAGSLALENAPRPKRDAFIVKQMREAGAVLLGKTNLSEWANFRSTRSISGWSGRGGQTNNPYILDQNPCGSSAGSGVAVSANLAAVTIGTETNGSIICPATRNGVVGIKPTLGLVSRSGIIPIAHTQDTAGPMARTVADAAVLLGVIAGPDKRDRVTLGSKALDYRKYLNPDGLNGARIGVARQFVGDNAPVKEIMEAHFRTLEQAGATLVDVEFKMPETHRDDTRSVLMYEFKNDLNKYLAERRSPYKTLADLIKYNEDNKDREMPLFAQELFEQSQAKGELTDDAYTGALARIKRATREDGIDAVITKERDGAPRKERLDAIFSPAVGGAWSIPAVAGYPSITVPAGFVDGMPVGILFFGAAYTDADLIKYAYAFEQKTKSRRKPEFLPGKAAA